MVNTGTLEMGGLRKERFSYEEELMAEFVQSDDISCGNKTRTEAGIEFVEGTNLQESDDGIKLWATSYNAPF